MKKLIIGFALGIALIMIFVVFMLFRVGAVLLEAENRSWATYNTCAIIEIYITQSDAPQWPTSWDDLADITHTTQWPNWPEERAYYEANVSINFEATLGEISQMTQDNFDAVQPIGPDNQFHDIQFPPLIKAARAASEASTDAQVP